MGQFKSKAFERAILLAMIETPNEGEVDEHEWPELDAIGVDYNDTLTFVTALVGGHEDIDLAISEGTSSVAALLVSTFQYGLQIGVHLERQRGEGLGDENDGSPSGS